MAEKKKINKKKEEKNLGGGPGFEGQKEADRDDALKSVEESQKTINVVHGAHDMDVELVGFTVAEIQNTLKDVLNTGDNVEAYVDGKLVEDKDVTLEEGQRLEFMKEAGQKG